MICSKYNHWQQPEVKVRMTPTFCHSPIFDPNEDYGTNKPMRWSTIPLYSLWMPTIKEKHNPRNNKTVAFKRLGVRKQQETIERMFKLCEGLVLEVRAGLESKPIASPHSFVIWVLSSLIIQNRSGTPSFGRIHRNKSCFENAQNAIIIYSQCRGSSCNYLPALSTQPIRWCSLRSSQKQMSPKLWMWRITKAISTTGHNTTCLGWGMVPDNLALYL